jgi:hemoglobin/transferrin/lactoferrin receptor protein
MHPITRAAMVTALLAGTALGSGTASAQSAGGSPATTPAAEAPASPASLALDEISVSATRSPGPAFSYPGMVTVIERDQIDREDPSATGDLFRSTPGVFFEGGPRRTGQVPSIRGFEGENVQVRIDGTRQNFVSGHDGRFFLDPEMIGGAEALRGPASSLYGSGAIGGVLSFRTLDAADLLAPDETVGGRVKVGYQGVNDEFLTSLSAAGRPSKDTEVVGAVTRRASGDIRLGNGQDLDSEDDILTGLVKGKARFGDGVELTLSYLGFKNDAVEPDNGQDGNAVSATTPLVDKTIRNDTVSARVNWTPSFAGWVDLDAQLYFAETSDKEENPTDGSTSKQTVESMGFDVSNRTRLAVADGTRLTLVYGVDGNRDTQAGTDTASSDGTQDGVPDADATLFGAYVQGEFEIASVLPGTLRVIPGVRFDYFETEADGESGNEADEVSPKLGVSYEPVPGLIGFASAGRAFRAPSFNELYLDGTHFAIPLGGGVTAVNSFVPNPDLEPETADTVEFGAGYQARDLLGRGDSFRVKGSYYYSRVDNLIDIQVDTSGPTAGCFVPTAGPCNAGTTTSINRAEAELSGVEIEAGYDHPRFYAKAGFNSIDGEDTDTGEKLGILKADTLTADVGVKLREIDSVIGVQGEFAGRFDKVDDAADERAGYSVFDVYLQWAPSDPTLKGVVVNLGVDNVFDRDYERVHAGVSEPGRNYKASIGYRLAF